MIERYSRKEMNYLWSRENRYNNWLKVELAVCKSYAGRGIIPQKDYRNIVKKAAFDIDRIDAIEREVKHDVIAFLTSVAEHVGPSSRFIHMGMTSSDMLDTANALVLRDSSEMIIRGARKIHSAILNKAKKYRDVPIMGRSHGVHAEPTTVGLKMLIWADDMNRSIEIMKMAKKHVGRGKISGAVGNYANISPAIETEALRHLKLKRADISSQIISRDVYADYIYAIARIGSIIEKIALQIRLLQRTETGEMEEPFTKGQKGSSAMPHKRNPVTCEQMCGLARILRSNVQSAMENIALWDERDISHSSVERVILPDSSILIDYMMDKMLFIVKNIKINRKNMQRNMHSSNNIFFSQRILLALVERGMLREDAYRIVQKNAMEAYRKGIDFKEILLNDMNVRDYLSAEDIEKLFDINHYLVNVKHILKRF